MILRDKDGWPVETIKGRPITNFIRRVLHTSLIETIKGKRACPTCNMSVDGHGDAHHQPGCPNDPITQTDGVDYEFDSGNRQGKNY